MAKGFTLFELAEKTSSELIGDPSYVVAGVDTLEDATSRDASFLANIKYLDILQTSSAGVICISPETPRLEGRNYLISKDPSRTFQALVELFLPKTTSGFTGIHSTAIIHESAKIHPTASIGPYAVIDQRVTIGAYTQIQGHVSIAQDVQIGESCTLHAGSVIREGSILGNRVILQPCAVIGSCGFGYTMDAKGAYQKLEQLGIVILEDDVEIGAHTSVDRARFKATIIRRGTKIDNLCQVAHNVELGEDNAIAAQSGIAGSSKTGRHVILAGQVGVAGHLTLGDKVMVTAQSGVSKSLKPGKYRGSPAVPMTEFNRREVFFRRLEKDRTPS
jgi:UDP-3-O-[3-hydroxymyristoyl] glucosamine N-acyltransferase